MPPASSFDVRRVAALMASHAREDDREIDGAEKAEEEEGRFLPRRRANASRFERDRDRDAASRPPPAPPASAPPVAVVCAVIENRAHEVGIALFDREDGGGGALVLEQHVEGGASYGATLCELASSRPGVVLVVGGAGGGDGGMGINRAVRRFARARDVAIVELSRRLFGARDAGEATDGRRTRVVEATAARSLLPVVPPLPSSSRLTPPSSPLPPPPQTTPSARSS